VMDVADLSTLDVVVRVVGGALLGAVVGIERESGQHWPQRVVLAGRPSQRFEVVHRHACGLEQVGVEIERDTGVGQLRHPPQLAVAGELVDH